VDELKKLMSGPGWEKMKENIKVDKTKELEEQNEELLRLKESMELFHRLLTPAQKIVYFNALIKEKSAEKQKLSKALSTLNEKAAKTKEPPKKTLKEISDKEAQLSSINSEIEILNSALELL